MCILFDQLQENGCTDMARTMERFINDEEFYKECLVTSLQDKAFGGLKTALEEDRRKEAFEYAHTLKGLMANMGLTPVYDLVVQIVEPLRAGENDNLIAIYEQMMQEVEKFRKIVLAQIG